VRYDPGMDLDRLPGGDLVRKGVADLAAGRDSVEALLVRVGRPKLARLGFSIPESAGESPEHALYRRLARSDPRRAHSRYNALIRRLVSFERAARSSR
jgi:hypothetical protein